MEEPKPQNPIQVILGDISENLRNIHLETSVLKKEIEYLGKREIIDVDNELQRFKKELYKVSSEMDRKYLSFLDNFKKEIAEKTVYLYLLIRFKCRKSPILIVFLGGIGIFLW